MCVCVCVYLWQCVRRSQLALCCANFSAGVKRRKKREGGASRGLQWRNEHKVSFSLVEGGSILLKRHLLKESDLVANNVE